jgi:small-conductance mechanosensitive channel
MLNIAKILIASVNEFLSLEIIGNTIKQYLIALFVFLATVLVLRIFRSVGLNKLEEKAKKTKTDFDDVAIRAVRKIGWLLYLVFALYVALQFLKVERAIERVFYYLLLLSLVYYGVKAVGEVIDFTAEKIVEKRRVSSEKFDPHTINFLANLAKGTVWIIAFLIVLQNLGYNISALIAGLGIGGVAVAFALQNILGDIFASFSIYFDKPFQVGDFIIIGKDMGTVKKIGIKSTRIQTLEGQELVVSNRELTDVRVNNYKKMEKRRVVFSFGVEYETPTEKLRKIPAIVKEIIDGLELAEFDRAHFKEFGDFSLNFEVVYYMKTPDYAEYMNTQQALNLALKERFEQERIVFAYPTQTIYLNKTAS